MELTLLALALPPLLGVAWLDLLVPRATAARGALLWGYGTLLGLVAVPLVMRLVDGLGFSPLFPVTGPVVAALILPALLLRLRRRAATGVATGGTPAIALPLSHRVLLAVLAGLLLLRLASLGLEIL